MPWRSHPYVLLLFGTAVLAVSMLVYAGRQYPRFDSKRTVLLFGALCLSISLWSFGTAVQLASTTAHTSLLFFKLSLLGSETTGPLWLLFVLAYLGHDRWVRRNTVVAVLFAPLVFFLTVPTNPWSLAFVNPQVVTVGALPTVQFEHGPLYALALANSHVTALVGIGLVSVRVVRSRGRYRRRATLVLLSAVVPVGLNLVELLDVFPPEGIGLGGLPAPASVAVTVIALAVALFHYRILDVVPAGRTHTIEHMRDGYLVLDEDGQIVDANRAARVYLGADTDELVGRGVSEFLPVEHDLLQDETHTVTVADEGDRRYLEVSTSPLEVDGVGLGRTLLLRDVTDSETYRQVTERTRDLIDDVYGHLVQSSGKRTLLQSVCDRLVEWDDYSAAWVGHRAVPNGVALRAWAGQPEEDTESMAGPSREASAELVRMALDADGVTLHHEAPGVSHGTTDCATRTAGVATIPLVHRGITHGVLAVYTARRGGFSEDERRSFADLGQIVAFALTAIEHRNALATDQVVELAVVIPNTEHYLASMSVLPGLDGRIIEVHEFARERGPQRGHLLRGQSVDADRFQELAEAFEEVSGVTPLNTTESDSLFLSAGSAESLGEPFVEAGGLIKSIEVQRGEVRVVAEFARRLTLHRALESLTDRYTTVDVVSIIERDHARSTPSPSVAETLTEKQREALQTAHFCGFFDRPQRQTAAEVAATLGVSRSTFLYHVRGAEQKVLTALFGSP